jgi:hypothetical protein
MDEYRRHLPDQLPPVALQFFAAFGRFEYALKRGNFLCGEINGKARPAWNRFANALGEQFFALMQAAPEARIFFEEPPKRLIRIADDNVAFDDPIAVVNGQRLFEAICRVRNNLFHGEKAFFSERDRALMEASLFVLDHAMHACADIEACRDVPGAFEYAPAPAGEAP